MKRLLVILIYALIVSCGDYEAKNRLKRALIYPQFTVFQFTYGLTVPMILPSRSINFSCCLQRNFDMPFNISHYDAYNALYAKGLRRNFDVSRQTFYKYIIHYINGFVT